MRNRPGESGTGFAIPVVALVGHSGSGKTTLLVNLIRELKRRGFRLAAVKHHRHADLDLDQPGKDSWRFAEAGASHVVIAGPNRVIDIRTFEEEATIEQAIGAIQGVDLVLVEGFKEADVPKIEVHRGQPEAELISAPDRLVAIVADRRFRVDVPQLAPDDVTGLADIIEARFLT